MVAPGAASGPGRQRPTRAHRVRKRREFLAIQTGGARVAADCLVFVFARRAPGEAETRLGITASRKIGNAVQRNRAKRLIREAFRQLLGELPGSLDLVVIVRKPLGERKLLDILGEWRRALPQLRRKASG